MFSVVESLGPLGIKVDRSSGVFWGQCLSRLVENILKHDKEPPKYILTMDYDTWFKPEHIIRLYQLLEENPEYDCLIPLQTKRCDSIPMLAIDYNQEETTVPKDYFEKEISDIEGGHFGLTLFRLDAFKDLKKPWFLAKPNEDGEWSKGRTDEDIYFWRNFSKQHKVGLANDVVIGHMQMFCTFSGLMPDGWRPTHVNMEELVAGTIPEHCIPRIGNDFIEKLKRKTGRKTSGARKAERERRRVLAKNGGNAAAGNGA
jgi:hypothetical protein